jgi:hypothetical protein
MIAVVVAQFLLGGEGRYLSATISASVIAWQARVMRRLRRLAVTRLWLAR